MMENPAYLILLLPLAWMLVIAVRVLMGTGFKSRDSAAKDDGVAISRWQGKQQYAQQRLEEGKKALAFQDELEEHQKNSEQIYSVHESRLDHIKKEFHVGEEKEMTYPEIKRPKK